MSAMNETNRRAWAPTTIGELIPRLPEPDDPVAVLEIALLAAWRPDALAGSDALPGCVLREHAGMTKRANSLLIPTRRVPADLSPAADFYARRRLPALAMVRADAPAAPAGAAAPAEPTEPAAPAQSPALLDAGSPDAGSSPDPAAEPAAEPAVEAPAGWLAAPVWARRMVAVGVVVPLITCALTASDLPLWAMTEKNYGAPSSRNPAARQVLDAIPEGASVETDLTLLAYLVPKATVSWVGTSGSSGQAKDYVVVDSRSTAWGGRPPKDAAQWATQSRHVAYELVLDVDGFQVAKRID